MGAPVEFEESFKVEEDLPTFVSRLGAAGVTLRRGTGGASVGVVGVELEGVVELELLPEPGKFFVFLGRSMKISSRVVFSVRRAIGMTKSPKNASFSLKLAS